MRNKKVTSPIFITASAISLLSLLWLICVAGVLLDTPVPTLRVHLRRWRDPGAHPLSPLDLQQDRPDLRVGKVAPRLPRVFNHRLECMHKPLLLRRGVGGEAQGPEPDPGVLQGPAELLETLHELARGALELEARGLRALVVAAVAVLGAVVRIGLKVVRARQQPLACQLHVVVEGLQGVPGEVLAEPHLPELRHQVGVRVYPPGNLPGPAPAESPAVPALPPPRNCDPAELGFGERDLGVRVVLVLEDPVHSGVQVVMPHDQSLPGQGLAEAHLDKLVQPGRVRLGDLLIPGGLPLLQQERVRLLVVLPRVAVALRPVPHEVPEAGVVPERVVAQAPVLGRDRVQKLLDVVDGGQGAPVEASASPAGAPRHVAFFLRQSRRVLVNRLLARAAL
mmetsp:Transcript_2285/g.7680  ORF Transcript_2285/g.7680 Transcript_2285/m.7680 type:complete len:394 (-) Transcript_2285:356-1537(-)